MDAEQTCYTPSVYSSPPTSPKWEMMLENMESLEVGMILDQINDLQVKNSQLHHKIALSKDQHDRSIELLKHTYRALVLLRGILDFCALEASSIDKEWLSLWGIDNSHGF
jgi:hypothetical protein